MNVGDADGSDFDDFDIDIDQIRESEAAATSKKTPNTSQESSNNCHHVIDCDSLSTYIYPTNLEVRDYQAQ